MTVHFVMMGVCGCGKTTAALALQRFLNGCPYAEGDEFHTQENRDKMGAGIPLTDEDRYPWLCRLRDWMTERSREGVAYSVVTCSALKRSYRDILRGAEGKVVFVHLTPTHDGAQRALYEGRNAGFATGDSGRIGCGRIRRENRQSGYA